MNRFGPGVAILIGLSLLTCGCSRQNSEASEPTIPATPREVIIPVPRQAGIIRTEVIEPTEMPDVIHVPGRIVLSENGNWRVGAIISGRIESVFAGQGDYVRAGQVLARMHSHDVHEAKAAYLTARAERSRAQAAETVAQKNYERTERLYGLKAASLEQTELAKQQWIDVQTTVRDSEIAVERERAHLEENLGISVNELSDNADETTDLVPIRAPASGYVLQRNVTPGTVVEPSVDLFVIGELRHLWLMVSVREEYIARLLRGQPATITVNGLPNLRVDGRVTNVGEQFDPTTHMMQVRIEFDNPANRLRPEMLAEAEIRVGAGKAMLLVPADAVQQIDEQDSVFVRTSADHFALRPVRTAQQVGDRVPVIEGLDSGSQVVTQGAFVLKSELLKSSLQDQ